MILPRPFAIVVSDRRQIHEPAAVRFQIPKTGSLVLSSRSGIWNLEFPPDTRSGLVNKTAFGAAKGYYWLMEGGSQR